MHHENGPLEICGIKYIVILRHGFRRYCGQRDRRSDFPSTEVYLRPAEQSILLCDVYSKSHLYQKLFYLLELFDIHLCA